MSHYSTTSIQCNFKFISQNPLAIISKLEQQLAGLLDINGKFHSKPRTRRRRRHKVEIINRRDSREKVQRKVEQREDAEDMKLSWAKNEYSSSSIVRPLKKLLFIIHAPPKRMMSQGLSTKTATVQNRIKGK
ncbi:hypothetical protein CBL_10991 [Carabus blaptoides fortunei]